MYCCSSTSLLLRFWKEGFYLTMHSTHLQLYGVGHMVKDHLGRKPAAATWITFQLKARFFYGLMGPQFRIDPMTHRTMSERRYHRATSHSISFGVKEWMLEVFGLFFIALAGFASFHNKVHLVCQIFYSPQLESIYHIHDKEIVQPIYYHNKGLANIYKQS